MACRVVTGGALAAVMLVMAGCGGVPTYELARSPAMISYCVAPGEVMQAVVDMAQRHCVANGGNAVLLGQQADGCSRLGRGPAYPGTVMHFRCEK
jgi:hypothetical protein